MFFIYSVIIISVFEPFFKGIWKNTMSTLDSDFEGVFLFEHPCYDIPFANKPKSDISQNKIINDL